MRVTIEFPDDVHLAAKALAKARGITLGQLVSEATEKKLRDDPPRRKANFHPRGASAPPRPKRG